MHKPCRWAAPPCGADRLRLVVSVHVCAVAGAGRILDGHAGGTARLDWLRRRRGQCRAVRAARCAWRPMHRDAAVRRLAGTGPASCKLRFRLRHPGPPGLSAEPPAGAGRRAVELGRRCARNRYRPCRGALREVAAADRVAPVADRAGADRRVGHRRVVAVRAGPRLVRDQGETQASDLEPEPERRERGLSPGKRRSAGHDAGVVGVPHARDPIARAARRGRPRRQAIAVGLAAVTIVCGGHGAGAGPVGAPWQSARSTGERRAPRRIDLRLYLAIVRAIRAARRARTIQMGAIRFHARGRDGRESAEPCRLGLCVWRDALACRPGRRPYHGRDRGTRGLGAADRGRADVDRRTDAGHHAPTSGHRDRRVVFPPARA